MKTRIALLVLFVFAAIPAKAQTTLRLGGTGSGGVTFVSTAAQDALTAAARDIDNAALCLAYALPKTCSQAQLNAKPGCAAGACGTVFTSDGAGAAAYAMDRLVSGYFSTLSAKVTAAQVNDIAAQAGINGGQVATNLQCTNAGLAIGCTKFAASCMTLSGTPTCKP